MELRFLVDTQLPPSLAEFFRRRGFNATHTIDYPSGSFMPDNEIISIAINEKRIVITKDSDFFDYFLLKGYPPAILLLQLGNMKNSDLFQFLKKHLEIITKLFEEEQKRMILVNSHQITVY
jgi:predicted nuclease of predicted toxin-antitoxin system